MASKKQNDVEAMNPPVEDVNPEEELVEIPPLFFDKDKYSAPVFVGVNGKSWLIQRGVSGIKVPKVVAEVLEQSAYQEQQAMAYMKKNEGIKNLGEF